MSLDPLDIPYDPDLLETIRDHIHHNLLPLDIILQRSDYILLFDEAQSDDARLTAGRPIRIIINCSPFNGHIIRQRLRSIFYTPRIIKELKRSSQVVRQKDIMLWQSLSLFDIDAHDKRVKADIEARRYSSRIISHKVKVETVDNVSGKKAILEAEYADAFSVMQAVEKLMRGQEI